MKTIPFSLDKYVPGKSIVQTRDGRKVRILATDAIAAPIVGQLFESGSIHVWPETGWFYGKSISHMLYLFLVVGEKYREWKPDEVPVGALFKNKAKDCFRSLIISVDDFGVKTMSNGSESIYNNSFEDCLTYREHSTDQGKTWKPCGVLEAV